MIKNVVDLTSQDFSKGVNTIQDFFKLAKEETPNAMNVKFDFDGKMGKRLGTTTRNTVSLSQSSGTIGVTTAGWASFDFGSGSNNIRWYCVAAGTAVWASSDMGLSFVRVASGRTQSYQYLDRSKNILVMTSDAYDPVLYWPGSAGTFAALLNVSAPLAKYSINFQGFLILLNSSTNKRGFYYENENTQLTGGFNGTLTTGGSFDLPSSFDDEVTGAFTLSNKLFVSTRYNLFAVSFVGGNPDWAFRKVKDWGYVPRTVDKITFGEVGEVSVGMDWNRRLRLFDGLEDRIISDKVENDNGMCDFATQKISYTGSGLTVSFGKTDDNEQVYKLGVSIGATSGQVTHFLCLNGRTTSLYPYDYIKTGFMSMCMAESGNRRFLLAVDQSGWVHMMDSGNLDRNTYAVDDVVDSPFMFDKSPSQSSKTSKIDMFFTVNSAGKILYQDRIDFSGSFTTRQNIYISSSNSKVQYYESIDIPSTQNTYQYRLTSSSSTTVPWQLNRTDYFLSGLGIGKEQPR